MKNIKTLYVRNVLGDLLSRKKAVGTFIVICAVLFGILGLRQGGKTVELTEEQKQEIEDYNTKIAEYDASIEDTKKCVEEADAQIKDLQDYVDNSIYMQIDPNNVQVISSQYGVVTGNNVGNICNSIIAYINDGGLKEPLDSGDEDLDIKYWRDVVGAYQSGNTLTIYVLHHNMDQARRIMNIMKKRIMEYLPKVQSVQGDFSWEEMRTSEYTKADAGILNAQNNNRNNLKTYTTSRSDQNSKLVNLQNNKTSYIEKNKPENMDAVKTNSKLVVVEYAILGILLGVIVSFVCVALKYIIGDTLRKAEDLKDSSLNLLGTYHAAGQYTPDLERSRMDIEILAQEKNARAVFLNLLSEDELSKKVAVDYKNSLNASEIHAEIGGHLTDDAAELKNAISCGSCVLIAQAGKTTYQQMEQMTQLCERFHIAVLGCVVIE